MPVSLTVSRRDHRKGRDQFCPSLSPACSLSPSIIRSCARIHLFHICPHALIGLIHEYIDTACTFDLLMLCLSRLELGPSNVRNGRHELHATIQSSRRRGQRTNERWLFDAVPHRLSRARFQEHVVRFVRAVRRGFSELTHPSPRPGKAL